MRVSNETQATDAPAEVHAVIAGVVATVDVTDWPRCIRPNCKRPIDPRFADTFQHICTRCAITENTTSCAAYWEEKKRVAYARLVASGLVVKRVNHHTVEEEKQNDEVREEDASGSQESC